ncbi:hypothetical protein JCM14469_31190 [Desulfatiferula olefinivorans]
MPIVTLKFKDNVIKTYSFAPEKSISIGRRENNDIVIANLTVSGSHAKIDPTGDGYLLTDLKSKNHTYINGEPVTSVTLSDGDVVSIGKHTLLFQLGQGERLSVEQDSGMDQTMAMNTDAHRDLIRQAMSSVKDETRQAMLNFIEGGEGKIELNRNLIKIGKDPANDVVVQGFMVGKTAALISRTPQGFAISHYGGLTKVKVNNQVIRTPVLLEEFDVIRIGATELQFFYR